jgi:small subunit ribosomal protein S21
MPEVIVRKGEPIDRALKRLKNKLDAEGIMEEVRRLRAFETPSQKVRRKAKLAAKRGKLKFRFNPQIILVKQFTNSTLAAEFFFHVMFAGQFPRPLTPPAF